MRVAVIVASVNRSEEMSCLLGHLARQSHPASQIVLSVSCDADLPAAVDPSVQIVMGPKGLTAQRNRGLEQVLAKCDAIVFFDDDFVPDIDALQGIAALLQEQPDVAGATGLVVADGVTCGGFTDEEAVNLLRMQRGAVQLHRNIPTDALYGCNMAFRATAVGEARFDEALPLYGWQEDVDFAGQLMRRGRIVNSTAFRGVHRGVQKGRTPGTKLGFSQIVNPVYLMRKGTMRPMKALRLMLKNLLANHIKSLRPEAFIDRTGRMRGNWLGLWHVATQKPDPTAILRLL